MGIAFFFVNMLIRNWTTFAVLYLGIPTFFFVWLHFYTNTEMAITMKHDLRLSTFLIHAKTRLSNFQFSFQRGKRGRRCFFSSQLYHIWRIISHWWRNPSKVSEGFTEGEFHGEKFGFFICLSFKCNGVSQVSGWETDVILRCKFVFFYNNCASP